MKKSNKKITAEEFDKLFETEDIAEYLNMDTIRINRKVQRVNIDFPTSLLRKIDQEAHKIGVARTALIKLWLAEKLKHI